jgi:hypothetical protein
LSPGRHARSRYVASMEPQTVIVVIAIFIVAAIAWRSRG